MNNIILTNNQIQLLLIIQSFRYIPFKALHLITNTKGLYKLRPSLSRVIIKLKKQNLIRTFLYGNNQSVVYITKKGARVLALEIGRPIKEIHIPNQGQKRQFSTLEHTIKIVEVYAQLEKTAQSFENIKVQNWLGDQSVICKYEFRSNRRGNKIRRVLVPDSYFEIIKDKKIIPFFLEYDTGTMDKNQLVPKFMRYFEYYCYGAWQEKYKVFPNVLFLTERSEKGLQNLLSPPETQITSAINNRKHFMESNNLLWRGLGIAENIRSIPSSKINGFLNCKFLFNQTNTKWTNNILKELE